MRGPRTAFENLPRIFLPSTLRDVGQLANRAAENLVLDPDYTKLRRLHENFSEELMIT